MKHLTAFLLLCNSFCMAQINEDFSSKSLSQWKGDTAKFTVNTAGQLQSNASTAGSSWLCLPFVLDEKTAWNFWLNMAFSPSGTNKLKVYLYADHEKIDSISNGFYCIAGETGTTDSYDFYLQRKGKKDSLLISGTNGWAGTSNNKASVKITPCKQQWIVSLDPSGDENFTILDTLPQYFSGKGFYGISCKYSASNAKKFFFDDISVGTYTPDTIFAKYGDVLITEIMADPDPSIGLAYEEYIELVNHSASVINLKNWTLSVNEDTITFPKILLQPGEYYVLSHPPSLLNEGAHIALYAKETLIHSVAYSKKWYADPFKEEGGWSLEMKDLSKPCLGEENWTASLSPKGGTPGKINASSQSIGDEKSPEIDYFSCSGKEILLHFSEPVYYTSVALEMVIDSVFYENYPQAELKISLKDSLEKNTICQLQISFSDCAGNTFSNSPFFFALPDSAAQNDIVINEILFNPFGDGADFVELYNHSDKVIDLSQLRFSSRDDKGFLSAAEIISGHPLYLFPNEYAAFTTDKYNVAQSYSHHNEKRIFELSALPSFNNDAGNICLIWPNGSIIDEFSYSEKMHDDLLDESDGVSLERIHPNLSQWHSAAQDAGWATPGMVNSQYLAVSAVNEFHLHEKILTPNEDGFKDFALISYALGQPGYKGTLQIYDASGQLIKTLADKFSLGTQGEFQWNGSDENGVLLPAGIYIAYAEYFNDERKVKHWKESIVLQR
ncbi:MAG: lamin tail domain-containing protein [Flavobacteriales bacterium]